MVGRTIEPVMGMDINQVRIRRLAYEDLPALEWNGEFIHFRNVYEGVYRRMQNGTAEAWVAESGRDGIVGQVFLQLDCDRPELANGWNRAYLYSFRIKPEYRNLGLGTRMLDVLQNYLVKRKFTRLTLNVARDNPDARRLYERLGFQIVADEPGIWSYKDHNGKIQTVEEPSWRMEKKLREFVNPDPGAKQ